MPCGQSLRYCFVLFLAAAGPALLGGPTTPAVAAARVLYQLTPAAPIASLPSTPAADGTAAQKTTPLRPSPLSEIYSAATFQDNTNFTFLPGYDTVVTGAPGEKGFTVQLINTTTSQNLSAWHDIPLGLERSPNGSATIWVLVEIPEGEQAKYETMVSSFSSIHEASASCMRSLQT